MAQRLHIGDHSGWKLPILGIAMKFVWSYHRSPPPIFCHHHIFALVEELGGGGCHDFEENREEASPNWQALTEEQEKRRKLFEAVGSIYYLFDDFVETRSNIMKKSVVVLMNLIVMWWVPNFSVCVLFWSLFKRCVEYLTIIRRGRVGYEMIDSQLVA